ncbi:MAG: DNA cytosine methyltransferase [Christensenellaceae bacterium]
MENVPTLLSQRHFSNFQEWINELTALGYESKYIQVNAKNYGIPQNRPRLLMMSVYVGNDEILRGKIKEYFDSLGKNEEKVIEIYKNSKYYKEKQIKICFV